MVACNDIVGISFRTFVSPCEEHLWHYVKYICGASDVHKPPCVQNTACQSRGGVDLQSGEF